MGQDRIVAIGFSLFVIGWVTWLLTTLSTGASSDTERTGFWSGVLLSLATGGLALWGSLAGNLWIALTADYGALVVAILAAVLANDSFEYLGSIVKGMVTMGLYKGVSLCAVIWVLAVGP